MNDIKEVKEIKEIKEKFFNLINFIKVIISSAPRPFFDFRGADLCLNEVRHGWVVLTYVPFVPRKSKCKYAL